MSYKELMLKFVSTDDLRVPMKSVSKIGEFVYATDGHVAIKVPLSLYDAHVESVNGYPNIEAVWPERNIDLIFESKNLESIIDSLPKKPVMDDKEIKCASCDGSGYHRCQDCEDDHECRKCEGEGFITIPGKNVVGHRIKETDHLIKINNAYFNPNLLMLLVEVLKHENIPIFNVLSTGERAMVVRAAEIELLIMPMRLNSNDVKIHTLK